MRVKEKFFEINNLSKSNKKSGGNGALRSSSNNIFSVFFCWNFLSFLPVTSLFCCLDHFQRILLLTHITQASMNTCILTKTLLGLNNYKIHLHKLARQSQFIWKNTSHRNTQGCQKPKCFLFSAVKYALVYTLNITCSVSNTMFIITVFYMVSF